MSKCLRQLSTISRYRLFTARLTKFFSTLMRGKRVFWNKCSCSNRLRWGWFRDTSTTSTASSCLTASWTLTSTTRSSTIWWHSTTSSHAIKRTTRNKKTSSIPNSPNLLKIGQWWKNKTKISFSKTKTTT